MITINRDQRCCALCKYWNGSIGSVTIQIAQGGNFFKLDQNEKHTCFKRGIGIEKTPMLNCPHFRPRYDD